jgi:hypothetical protein
MLGEGEVMLWHWHSRTSAGRMWQAETQELMITSQSWSDQGTAWRNAYSGRVSAEKQLISISLNINAYVTGAPARGTSRDVVYGYTI